MDLIRISMIYMCACVSISMLIYTYKCVYKLIHLYLKMVCINKIPYMIYILDMYIHVHFEIYVYMIVSYVHIYILLGLSIRMCIYLLVGLRVRVSGCFFAYLSFQNFIPKGPPNVIIAPVPSALSNYSTKHAS